MNYFLLLFVATSIISLKSCYAVNQGNTIFLIEAVRQRNLKILNWLISQEALVDIQDDSGATPLMHAASSKNTEDIMKALLEAGANADARDASGKTALHHAAEYGVRNAIEPLMIEMSNFNAQDNNGRTALHLAVLSGRYDIVTCLTEKGFDANDRDTYGLTAVHLAAMSENTTILKHLESTGADIDSKSSNGTTPLILASLFDQKDAVKYLINSGADVDLTDDHDWTALHAVAYTGSVEMVKLLLYMNAESEGKNSDGRTPLFLAAARGNLAASQHLVDWDSDLFVTDNCNSTLMHAAAESGNLKLIDLFVFNELGIDNANCNGSTPLIVAATGGNEDAVNLFINYNADTSIVKKLGLPFLHRLVAQNNTNSLKCVNIIDDSLIPNAIDDQGATLLHYAAKLCNEESTKYLIESMSLEYQKTRESDFSKLKILEDRKNCLPCSISIINSQDNNGKIPLHYAVEAGNLETVHLFLFNGANLSIPDSSGLSSFHTAALFGQTDTLKSLAPFNTDLNQLDFSGRTALFLAAEAGNLNSLKYLLNIGANWTITDNRGWTLLHVATINDRSSVVTELLSDDRLRPDIDVLDKQGRSAAWYAVSEGKYDILSDLKRSGAQIIPVPDIYSEIESGSVAFVQNYLQNAELTARDLNRDGQTILHLAVKKGYQDIVKELGKNVCLVNSLDKHNKTALWFAVDGEKWDCVSELEKVGGEIKPNVTFINAATTNQIGFVKYFIRKGVDVNSSIGGLSVFYWASVSGHTEVLRLLLESGADIEASHPTQNTSALQIAVYNGRCQAVAFLLKSGAKVNRINNNGHSALDFAKEPCRAALLEYGAKHARELNIRIVQKGK